MRFTERSLGIQQGSECNNRPLTPSLSDKKEGPTKRGTGLQRRDAGAAAVASVARLRGRSLPEAAGAEPQSFCSWDAVGSLQVIDMSGPRGPNQESDRVFLVAQRLLWPGDTYLATFSLNKAY